jgi:cyclic lactone autoinducer peptide
MKSIKEILLKKGMKAIGFIALFAGVLAINPNSTLVGHQPKCPDELLD